MENWLKVYLLNYRGESDEAKEIEPYLKQNYKGNTYVPWATMERLTYQQDPNAVFEIIEDSEGNIVHTSKEVNHQRNIQNDATVSETEATMYAHTVRVACTFLGKTFVEDYPIQDPAYEAPKIYNQNLVNKALQRAKAKVASRATGIGLKLYEGFDLQFDETNEEENKPKRPTIKKETKVEKSTKSATTTEKVELTEEQKVANIMDGGETAAFINGERTFTTQDVKDTPMVEIGEDVKELYDVLHNNDIEKVTEILQKLNTAIVKKYGFALDLDDSIEVFNSKVSQLKDISKFTKSIKTMLDI